MTDTSTEDELVEKVARELFHDDVGSMRYWRSKAKAAISTARPLIAQQERESMMRELWGNHRAEDWPDAIITNFLKSFATEHGITLEEK